MPLADAARRLDVSCGKRPAALPPAHGASPRLSAKTFGGLFVLRAHAAGHDSGEFRVACREAAHMRSRCGLSRVAWCSRPSRGRSERGFGAAGVTGTLRVSVNSTAAALGRTVVALARHC